MKQGVEKYHSYTHQAKENKHQDAVQTRSVMPFKR